MVAVLTFAGGVAALDAQAIYYLMPFIVAELALSNQNVGLIGSAVLLGWAISGVIIGQLSDRVGRRKPFLVGAFICFALLSAFSGFALGFATLFAARFCMGLAEGPVIPVKQAIVIEASSPSRVGLNMGIAQNFGAQLLGSLVAPLLLVAVASEYGWRPTFLLAGLPGLLVAFLIHRYIREPKIAWPAKEEIAPAGTMAMLRNVVKEHNVRVCIVGTSCGVACFFLLLTFLPIWLTRELQLSDQMMSWIMAIIGLAGVVSSMVVPGLSDRLGRRPVMVAFTLCGVLGPLGLLLLQPHLVLMCMALFAGCFILGTFPLWMATVPMQSVSASHRSTATALVLCVGQILGGLAGPAVGGLLADRFTLDAPLLLAGFLAIVGALAALLLRGGKHSTVLSNEPLAT